MFSKNFIALGVLLTCIVIWVEEIGCASFSISDDGEINSSALGRCGTNLSPIIEETDSEMQALQDEQDIEDWVRSLDSHPGLLEYLAPHTRQL